ncbi:poly(A) polymerase [compost metagenome]
MRELAGEETDGLGQWWTEYQECNESERRDMIRDLGAKDESGAPRKRRRSGTKRKRSGSDASSAAGE